MSKSRQRQPIAPGHRGIRITIPARLVADLDRELTETAEGEGPISRSAGAAVAIRRFLEQGGASLLDRKQLSESRAREVASLGLPPHPNVNSAVRVPEPGRRTAPGHRTVHITIRSHLIVELDRELLKTAGDQPAVSRSTAISEAVRRFLAQGGASLLDSEVLIEPFARHNTEGAKPADPTPRQA